MYQVNNTYPEIRCTILARAQKSSQKFYLHPIYPRLLPHTVSTQHAIYILPHDERGHKEKNFSFSRVHSPTRKSRRGRFFSCLILKILFMLLENGNLLQRSTMPSIIPLSPTSDADFKTFRLLTHALYYCEGGMD